MTCVGGCCRVLRDANAITPLQGCFNITTVFSHSQTVVVCGSCSAVLCQPTGGRARLTEGERLRPSLVTMARFASAARLRSVLASRTVDGLLQDSRLTPWAGAACRSPAEAHQGSDGGRFCCAQGALSAGRATRGYAQTIRMTVRRRLAVAPRRAAERQLLPPNECIAATLSRPALCA